MSWLRRWWLVFAVAGALVLAIASGMLFGSDRTQAGSQTPSPALRLELAARNGWNELESQGRARPGFPGPMVWREDGLCVGFSRVDFPADDKRPTLARCVVEESSVPLQFWEATVVATVRSGLDTWVFVDVSGELDSVEVRLAGGQELDPDRVHIYGSMFALRLPEDDRLGEVVWATARGRYRCTPADRALGEQQLCPDS